VGRLFWKIFIGFWIALVVAAFGTGTAVWVQRLERAREAPQQDLAVGPPHRIAIDMAAATLRHGGVEALRQWMNDWQGRRPLPVFAVNDEGRDLLGREVPVAALASARELAARGADGQGVRLVAAPGQENFLLFVPRGFAPEPPRAGGRRSPRRRRTAGSSRRRPPRRPPAAGRRPGTTPGSGPVRPRPPAPAG